MRLIQTDEKVKKVKNENFLYKNVFTALLVYKGCFRRGSFLFLGKA